MVSQAVLSRIAENPHLPSPTAVTLSVLERASQPDCSREEIAKTICLDPVLCGKILKTVNSALFGLPRVVSSIDRALGLLGTKPVRSLVLSLSLPAMYQKTHANPKMRDYWKSSVTGAVVARELAARFGRQDCEDLLVAGLLRDLGMLVLEQVSPEEYAQVLERPIEELIQNQCGLEEKLAGINHAEVSAFLLHRWRLPDEISEPVRYHHDPERAAAVSPEVCKRAYYLYFASRVAQFLEAPREREVHHEILELAKTRFSMNEEQLFEFLRSVEKNVGEFASVMNVEMGDHANLCTILENATRELAKLTSETNAACLRAKTEKHLVSREAARWRRAADRLRREVNCDPLTGVFNRNFLEEALNTELNRSRRRFTILGLVFIDLDNFKSLNDRFGHTFGDQALKQITAALSEVTRQSDVLARYGGDEFCVVVPDTSETGLNALATRLWKAVNRTTVRSEDREVNVTASIGAIACYPHSTTLSSVQLCSFADAAMYEAKKRGKNQVHIMPLLPDKGGALPSEIGKRYFSVYLAARGIVDERVLLDAAILGPCRRFRIGRLGRNLGWISPRKLRVVLQEQRKSKKPFGEVAVALGILTQGQIYSLLAIQHEPPEELAVNLIKQSVLDREGAKKVIQEYYAHVLRMD
jgi:diguanylate cyclase (GGDEF)-like protein